MLPATKLAETHQRLADTYGLRPWRKHRDPVGELVMTILSQNTSDVNTHRAFESLVAAYPGWHAVVQAPTEDIADAIRSGGLADQKAPRIQDALRGVYDERGAYDLDWLADLPVDEARNWLTQFHGVGNKTAAIVLLFSLGRPAFPVDTHVGRICRRLGIVPPKASADKTMYAVEALAPADWFYPLHINFIRHGRAVCKAQRPRCDACPLTDLCDWYLENQQTESTAKRSLTAKIAENAKKITGFR